MAKKLPYRACLARLSSVEKLGSKPGLGRISALCGVLGNPQNKFKSAIVAGTNGKGSTTAMLASILRASGFKTGSFFSPHVFDFRERVQINGKKIAEKDFAACLSEVFSAIDSASIFSRNPPTFFEILTAAAFLHFAKKKADYAVLEVGMGGRLDATNVCNAEICCISSISPDHVQYLGRTPEKIAYEKAGIAKKGKYLVASNSISNAALKKIKSECGRKGAKFAQPNASDIKFANSAPLRLSGSFQKANAATAACAARLLGITRSHISKGLSSAFLPGRLQKISSNPAVIADCAHNPGAAEAVAAELPRLLRKVSGRRVLLYSSMSDKDYFGFLSSLKGRFDSVVAFRPPLSRAAEISSLAAAAKRAGYDEVFASSSPKKALQKAKSTAGKNGAVLACGSMYSFQFFRRKPDFSFSQ